jgi:hypothetical protein
MAATDPSARPLPVQTQLPAIGPRHVMRDMSNAGRGAVRFVVMNNDT